MKQLVIAFALILGQSPVPYIETLDVTIHNIDVVVTDKSGKPVTGLREDDFEVLEDGKRKAITNFSSFDEQSASAAMDAPASAGEAAATPPEAARKLIFYVDEMALTEGSKESLLSQLDAMILQIMRVGDEALVVRPTQENRLGTGFTQDRQAVRASLKAAIEGQDWRSAPVQLEKIQLETDFRAVGPARERRIMARRYADTVRRRVKQRLGNLKSAVIASSAAQGRKVMIVISDSLPIEPGREAFRGYNDAVEYSGNDVTAFPLNVSWEERTTNPALEYDWFDYAPQVKEIARTAASGGITIYAVQPEIHLGVSAPGGGVDSPPPALRFSPDMNTMAPQGNSNVALSDTMSNTETTLRILTDVTGGRWFRGSGRIDEAAEQITGDVQSYYSLGYRASEGADIAHRIEVRVKGRKDVIVRTRKEVLRKSPEQAMNDSVVAALVDPSTPSEVPIRVEVEMGAPAADGLTRNVNVHALIPISSLTFLSEGEVRRARFTVHYAAMGRNAEFMSGAQSPQVLDIPASDIETAKTKYWRYIIPLTMRPGEHDIVVGVLDSVSRLSGIQRTSVVVESP